MTYAFDESYYLRSLLARFRLGGECAEETLRQTISDAGLTLQEHYERFGRFDGFNPNPYFNEHEYLAAKVRQLHSVGAKDGNGGPYTRAGLSRSIADAGLLPVEHYERIGAYETDAAGNYINPSNAFDVNAYFAAKLLQTWISNETLNGAAGTAVTMPRLLETLAASGRSPVTRYMLSGAAEAAGMALVQTVPMAQRVSNDPRRQSIGQLVPANYNSATPPPCLVTIPFPPPKPADVGGLAPVELSPVATPPAQSLPVPGEAEYAPPPDGWADTSGHPLVPAAVAGIAGGKALWVSVDKTDNSAIMLNADGSVLAKLPPGAVLFDAGAVVAEVAPESIPAPLFTELVAATAQAEQVHFTDGQADIFATSFGHAGVAEQQSADFAHVTLGTGQKLTIINNGATLELTNTTDRDLSGDELAAFVAEIAPDGWTVARDGALLTYTALTAGDKETLQIAYSVAVSAEQQADADALLAADSGAAFPASGIDAEIRQQAQAGLSSGEEFPNVSFESGGLRASMPEEDSGTLPRFVAVPVSEDVKGVAAAVSGSSLAMLDTIVAFNWQEDRISLPVAVTHLVKGAAELDDISAAGFSAVAGEEAGRVGAFQAGLFKFESAYYLFINDGDQAFNADRDIVIKLAGVSDADVNAMTTDIFLPDLS